MALQLRGVRMLFIVALIFSMATVYSATVIARSAALQTAPVRFVDDTAFNTGVLVPAFTKQRPRVLSDRAHFNFLTLSGRDRAFRELITNDGYEVVANTEKFQRQTLTGYQILVIAGAEGGDGPATWAQPAFSAEECDAVYEWVREGGSLLLLADHYPIDVAVNILASRFAVTLSKGWVSEKNDRHDEPAYDTGWSIMFTRENGLLKDHPITNGRSPGERVNRLLTVYGTSLDGPPGSEFLIMPRTATNQSLNPRVEASGLGRASGVAMKVGDGRVVVLADSSMFTARIVERGSESHPDGMSRRDLDGRQFALNVMRWLAGLIQ